MSEAENAAELEEPRRDPISRRVRGIPKLAVSKETKFRRRYIDLTIEDCAVNGPKWQARSVVPYTFFMAWPRHTECA